MATKKTNEQPTSTPAQWGPSESHRTAVPKGKTFTAYAVCPFDRLWGLDQWGYEIHGSRTRGVRDTAPAGPDVGITSLTVTVPEPDREPDLDIVTLTGSAQIKTTYTEPDRPGWTLPAGLTMVRPFSDAGEALLRQMHLVEEYADTFRPEHKLLRAALLTTCQIAPEILPTLSGDRIDAILRQHGGALGVVSETPAGGEVERPALDELEQQILFVFDEREVLTTNKQVMKTLDGMDIRRTENTIKNAVRRLLDLGLIERPASLDGSPRRKGSKITARGKHLLTTS